MKNCSVIFTNNQYNYEGILDVDKYICFDNKIHVRFRDFNKEEFIIGFEKKLVYLLSYLINYSYIPKLSQKYSNKTILSHFLSYQEVIDIIYTISSHVNRNFTGLTIKPNYKKHQNNYKYFGDVDAKFFPICIKEDLIQESSLNVFLDAFNISLYEYLFNDNYIIWLHNKEFKVNTKFETRKLRKLNNRKDKNINLVELW